MMKTVVKSALLVGLMVFSLGLYAQSLTVAGEKFNQGTAQYKARNFAGAVKLYEEALKMCKSIGPDAADLQSQVETQLGNSYFWNGISLYKKRAFDQAIAQLKKAKAMAAQTNNAKIKNYAHIYIARVYSSKGLSLIKEKKLDAAAQQFELALKEKPDCYNAYYGKVFLAKGKNDMAAMMAATDHLAQMAASNPKAGKRYGQAKYITFTTLLNAGAEQLQKMHPQKALQYLNDAKKYGTSNADLFYYTAVANLNLKKWDAAIAAAKKALSMQTSEKSDIYYTLGQAYQGKGNKTAACSAFKHVVKGPNVKAAQYQVKQVLKCK
jgi:tetratricopeptide (TPR) repeat protein